MTRASKKKKNGEREDDDYEQDRGFLQAGQGRGSQFTVIELLVVIAIIVILASMLMPGFVKCRHCFQGN